MVDLLLFFPKGQAQGACITPQHREVEIEVKLLTVEIKRKFKLSEIVYEGKLEL